MYKSPRIFNNSLSRLAFLGVFFFLNVATLFSQNIIFSPQGEVRDVTEVVAKFPQSMVSLGSIPKEGQVFEIVCSVPGKERWVDPYTWVYSFSADVFSGTECKFTTKPKLKSLAGKEIPLTEFKFNTGDPIPSNTIPYDGSNISEDQSFALVFDREMDESSLEKNAYAEVESISEKIPFRLVKDDSILQKIQKTQYISEKKFLYVFSSKRNFPPSKKVAFLLEKGYKTKDGVVAKSAYQLNTIVEPIFSVSSNCERENEKSDCVPISRIRLYFSSPVKREIAKKVRLKANSGKEYVPTISEKEEGNGSSQNEESVYGLEFLPPFELESSLKVLLPDGFQDENGRTGAKSISIKTAKLPPLAKFNANFGILESSNPVLPVTVRYIQKDAKTFVGGNQEGKAGKVSFENIKELFGIANKVFGSNRAQKFSTESPKDVFTILNKMNSADSKKSIFSSFKVDSLSEFSFPKPSSENSTEVVGIPLQGNGLYLVEIGSKILGQSLFGKNETYFVSTLALVTNLAIHFKQGKESSLVWVTELSSGKSVKGASISIHTCNGGSLFSGTTNQNGILNVPNLEEKGPIPYCQGNGGGLLVLAKLGKDQSFLHSYWNRGIETWRFNLPTSSGQSSIVAHTVIDRPIYRSGETVHMKHFVRKGSTKGFEALKATDLPKFLGIQYMGTNETQFLPVTWEYPGTADSTFKLPKGFKNGSYRVFLANSENDSYEYGSTYFRLESFKIPSMKAYIAESSDSLVGKTRLKFSVGANYLSGAPANGLKMKLRMSVEPRYYQYSENSEFAEYTFSEADVKEGVQSEIVYDQNLKEQEILLGKNGSFDATYDWKESKNSNTVYLEASYKDANGEMQTISKSINVPKSNFKIGLKYSRSQNANKDSQDVSGVVLDLEENRISGKNILLTAYQRKYYSSRIKILGGFYSYESKEEIKKIGTVCSSKTNAKGQFTCKIPESFQGEVIFVASLKDDSSEKAEYSLSQYVGGEDYWGEYSDNDRMDIFPNKKSYDIGDIIQLEVKTPFKESNCLVTVEREGILSSFTTTLKSSNPFVNIPVTAAMGPNAFVSVLSVRGRVDAPKETARVDLAKPSFKLGLTNIVVGKNAFKVPIEVSTNKKEYRTRESVQVKIQIPNFQKSLHFPSSYAIAVVDEGLLELASPDSWNLLESMLGTRSLSVDTYTVVSNVIGRRHFGRKSLPSGGGGGALSASGKTRELFDSLLFWKSKLEFNESGVATVEFKLQDSLTSYKIIVLGSSGVSLFGRGETSIQVKNEILLFSGLPLFFRNGDFVTIPYNFKNTSSSQKNLALELFQKKNIAPSVKVNSQNVSLKDFEAKEVTFPILVDNDTFQLEYELSVRSEGKEIDRLKIAPKVFSPFPNETYQTWIFRSSDEKSISVSPLEDSIPGSTKLFGDVKPSITGGVSSLKEYMKNYAYTCLEQQITKAVTLKNQDTWNAIMNELPTYQDPEGLLKFFPTSNIGSVSLTSKVLELSYLTGYAIPENTKLQMLNALKSFVETKNFRTGIANDSLPAWNYPDLHLRKLQALSSISLFIPVEQTTFDAISFKAKELPLFAILDLIRIYKNSPLLKNRNSELSNLEILSRSKLTISGQKYSVSNFGEENIYWLLESKDSSLASLVLLNLEEPNWKRDIPKLLLSLLGSKTKGALDTTYATAYATLAVEKYESKFEKNKVSGITEINFRTESKKIDWKDPKNTEFRFFVNDPNSNLEIAHKGEGSPYISTFVSANKKYSKNFDSGFELKKSIEIVEKDEATGTKVAKVTLEIQTGSDRNWVVIDDPIPPGAFFYSLSANSENGYGYYEYLEKTINSARIYYEYFPKGKTKLEYFLRLNTKGKFNMPPTRVECMYSPDIFSLTPNTVFEFQD